MELIKTLDEIIQPSLSNNDFSSKFLEILNLLSEFPNGITKTILDSHLELKKSKKNIFLSLSTSTVEKKKVYLCTVAELVDEMVELNNSIYTQMSLTGFKDTEWFQHVTANRQLRFTDTCSALMARPKSNNVRKDSPLLMIMPTKALVPVLDHTRDQAFISTFRDLIESLQPGIDYKVDEISFNLENSNCSVKVHDPSGTANLILWQDQILLSKLFEIGDLILIKDPFIESKSDDQELVLECGSQTEISLVPRDFQERKVSKEGCKRTTIGELKNYKSRSVSIYGRVTLQKVIEGSAPGTLIFGIRLQDETGFVDITITENTLGLEAIRSELGNFVFITDLDIVRSGSLIVLEATKSTKFIDVSMLHCIPASSHLHKLTPLVNHRGEDFFYTRAIITNLTLVTKQFIHNKCFKAVDMDDGIAFCGTCGDFAEMTQSQEVYKIELEDGTGNLTCSITDTILDSVPGLLINGVCKSLNFYHFGISNFRGVLKVVLLCLDPSPLYKYKEI